MDSSPRDDYRYDPRRFLVRSDRLALFSGLYRRGEVITDFQAGSARDRLLDVGVLVEVDYDLSQLWGRPEVL